MKTRLSAIVLFVFAMSLGIALTINAQGTMQHWAQVNTPANFPYYTGFESGPLGSEWASSFTNEGRVQVSPSYPYTGTCSLLLDDTLNNATLSIAAAILAVDLSGQSQVELDFWWREFADENHAEDGIFISDDNGAHWYLLFSFNDGPEFWRRQVLDLDAAAAAQGLTLNDHFQIKFQFYDGSPIPADGYAIDEVRVRAPHVPVPASFPYYTDFESGALGAEWSTHFTFEGRAQVGSSYAYTGTHSLLLDDARGDTTLSNAAAILSVDLGGQPQVELNFWWREFADENHAEDGVFISDDNGAHWFPLFSFNNGPEFWRRQIIDLDAAATAQGLTLNDHFQIKFQFYDTDSIPSDGYAIDEVRVRAPHVPIPASFPYYTGFESGALGAEWSTHFTFEGRVQVGSSYAYTGAYSLLLDDARGDTTLSNAAAILSVDLGGQPQVELDFWWREFADENHAEDGIFISDDNGAHWSPLFSFNNGPEFWRHQVLDLDAAAAAQGLTLNEHFQIKFQFYDTDSIPSDGYAIDEVRVRPNAAPTLAWLGDTDYQQDGLHPESGDVGDAYVYRITYVDVDADSPDFVRVHIQKGAIDIAGSPFAMTCAAGDCTLGVTCAYTRTGLNVGADYTYYFTGRDDQGNTAVPTAPIDAPDVTIAYPVYLPLIVKTAGPPAGAPILNPINNPSGDYKFTVSWSAVNLATSYTLQEDDNAAFSSPTTVYLGSSLSKLVYVQAVGTYYYRVKASNTFGESSWSNTQAVLVTTTPPPCPATGAWSGSGNRFSISYQVVQYGNTCLVQAVTGHLSAYCHGGGQNWSMYVQYVLPMATISNHQFYTSDEDTQVRGTFTTPTTVDGTWSYYYAIPYPPATCSGSGAWTGSH